MSFKRYFESLSQEMPSALEARAFFLVRASSITDANRRGDCKSKIMLYWLKHNLYAIRTNKINKCYILYYFTSRQGFHQGKGILFDVIKANSVHIHSSMQGIKGIEGNGSFHSLCLQI